jgi:arylformamidase
MQIIDLTHLMENKMPAYPGEKSPVFTKKLSHKKDGVQVLRINMLTHSGTHLDTPAHFFSFGATLDEIPVNNFIGKAILIDCTGFGAGEKIGMRHFKKHAEDLWKVEYVLIHTGWDKYWGNDKYYSDFPVLSEEAAKFLTKFKILGVGLDVPSVDPVGSANYPNHFTLLSHGIYIVENLTNLNWIDKKRFVFSAFPLKIKNGDGSPVRAVAIITRK